MKRIIELDGLRGLAALTIVTYHLAPGIAPQGWVSVDCFFVLSGYLISTILLASREDPHYLLNFYARRSLRIWPIYYLSILPVIAGYGLFATKYPINLSIILQYLTYTQDVQLIWGGPAGRQIAAFSHTWTLAIEEQFYLLWPFIIRVFPRRVLAPLCVAIALGSNALRGIGMTWIVLPARCDGFALGGLLALILSTPCIVVENRRNLGRLFVTVVIISGIAAVPPLCGLKELSTPWGKARFFTHGSWIVGFSCVMFSGMIGIIILNTGRPWLMFLRSRPLVYVGTISYGLYLYHIPILFAFEWLFRRFGSGHGFDGTRPIFRSILEMTASIIVAALSWRFIEKPILGFKDRFRPGAVPEVTASQSMPGPDGPGLPDRLSDGP